MIELRGTPCLLRMFALLLISCLRTEGLSVFNLTVNFSNSIISLLPIVLLYHQAVWATNTVQTFQ